VENRGGDALTLECGREADKNIGDRSIGALGCLGNGTGAAHGGSDGTCVEDGGGVSGDGGGAETQNMDGAEVEGWRLCGGSGSNVDGKGKEGDKNAGGGSDSLKDAGVRSGGAEL